MHKGSPPLDPAACPSALQAKLQPFCPDCARWFALGPALMVKRPATVCSVLCGGQLRQRHKCVNIQAPHQRRAKLASCPCLGTCSRCLQVEAPPGPARGKRCGTVAAANAWGRDRTAGGPGRRPALAFWQFNVVKGRCTTADTLLNPWDSPVLAAGTVTARCASATHLPAVLPSAGTRSGATPAPARGL